ncbi:probable G-protein coupled receptor No18 [Octopus sinensis]|uniref:Probable G-protein coupled receptor No18 n=1 Tax=Octopus sinensis TaxID=2607531 RepID=A0A6P7T4W4_9MOLL|nr:probable G-protein coupled receptor No18 [Octopus sinensis]
MEILLTTSSIFPLEEFSFQNFSLTNFSDENVTFSDKTIYSTPSVTNILISLFLALMIVGCIFGNVLVILSVILYKPLRSVQNFFIVSLAVSDLSVAALVMPFHVSNLVLGYWIYGWLLCEIWLTLDVLLCTSSILNLCAIAVDRYWAIHDPLNYAQKRTPTRVGLMIAAVWFVSAMVSIPPVFGWNESGQLYNEIEMQCHLTDDRSYVVFSAFGSFYIPLIMMTFIYFKIFLAIRRRLRKRREQTAMCKIKANSTNKEDKKEQSPESTPAKDKDTPPTPVQEDRSIEGAEINSEIHVDSGELRSPVTEVCVTSQNGGTHSRLSKEEKEKHGRGKGKRVKSFFEKKQKISLSKERKATRILGIVMLAFILCWLPFFLMYLILPFCQSCSGVPIFAELFIVWLGYVNSGLNPVIYTIFNEEFRKAFYMLLSGVCFKKKGRDKTSKL